MVYKPRVTSIIKNKGEAIDVDSQIRNVRTQGIFPEDIKLKPSQNIEAIDYAQDIAKVLVHGVNSKDIQLSEAIVMNKVLQLRKAGMSIFSISQRMNVSIDDVRRVIAEALHIFTLENQQSTDEMRALENERYDTLQTALWPSALAGDTKAALTIMRISKARREMNNMDLGTNAPQNHNAVQTNVFMQVFGNDPNKLQQITELAGQLADGPSGDSGE